MNERENVSGLYFLFFEYSFQVVDIWQIHSFKNSFIKQGEVVENT